MVTGCHEKNTAPNLVGWWLTLKSPPPITKSQIRLSYFHDTWHSGDLELGAPTQKIIRHLSQNYIVIWQTRNVSSSLAQNLWASILTKWWLRLRSFYLSCHPPVALVEWWIKVTNSHPLSHTTLFSCDHVRSHHKSKILYLSFQQTLEDRCFG